MERRYNSYVELFRSRYGNRLQKIVIDAGFTCPNRDGKVATGGCTYCNNDAFHPSYSTPDKTIHRQIEEGISFHRNRYRSAEKYLAYFQPYSNTYSDLVTLKGLFEEALSHPDVAGVVIGTRPDCIDTGKLDYLTELARHKIVILEYGIESIYDTTLKRINRGHDYRCAEEAVRITAGRNILTGAHFILGLPGESREQMLRYADAINSLPLDAVKFHQLQIIRGTAMEKDFQVNPMDFVQFELPQYIDFFIDILERLRPDVAIERFAGEVPPRFVEKTPWGKVRNVELIRMLEKRLIERNTYQSRLF